MGFVAAGGGWILGGFIVSPDRSDINVDAEVRRLLRSVYGDSNSVSGIYRDVDQLKRSVYRNPDTGAAGLVAVVAEHDEIIREARTTLRVLSWVTGILGLSTAGQLIQFFSDLLRGM